jgi:hypothetical protein
MEKIEFNERWTFSKKGQTVTVVLPHDAMQTEPRRKDAKSGSGCAFFEENQYIYEKHFPTEPEWEKKTIWLEIQGVYPNGTVFLNGNELGFCNYGYLNYFFALENLVPAGRENVLRIEVDNRRTPNSRWYSGAGLYRPVNLWIGGKCFIRPQGIQVSTEQIEKSGKTQKAWIRIVTEIEGQKGDQAETRVKVFRKGVCVAEGAGTVASLMIENAGLWTAETPELYDCEVELYKDGILSDTAKIRFGIRQITYGPQGLYVNGNEVLLKGGCIHHDNGILGAREYQICAYRKVKTLKEYGFNAIRSAHNPISEQMLKACDELGMYIMDETWDMWYTSKNESDYAEHFEQYWEKDIEALISRDYNHPSLLMYSIGNEVSEPVSERGIRLAEQMIKKCHRLDPARPVTCGINITILLMHLAGMTETYVEPGEGQESSEISAEQKKIADALRDMDSTKFNEMTSLLGQQMIMASASDEADTVSAPIFSLLDIAGYNYASSRYEMEGAKHPDRVIVGTETYAYQLDENWEAVKKYPYLIGDFMWTAWDYLGETGVGAWSYEPDAADFQKGYPWLLADTGALDILGNPNGEAGLAQAVWEASRTPFIGVVPVNQDPDKLCRGMWRGSNALPYYSYQGCDGRRAEIEIYSCGNTVELFRNGEPVGKKKLEHHKAVFEMTYESGELHAVVYDKAGEVFGENVVRSAKGRSRLRILPESTPKAGQPLYVDVDIVGENDEIECNADEEVKLTVKGGKLLAFGSAKPKTTADFLSGKYPTWYGRAQAVILPEEKDMEICAESGHLEKQMILIHTV